ncbi:MULTISPECIES: glutamyl-tRNA reductase [unclassified Paenibacillus]|uniref:glutamyl-tRNA reductase n=1 Tax=unclassified Paenibacillus TaxID=185978 RepID=UPI001C102540|nr:MULTISPECIES: glutamyl-tRNA reductase [unclassified Paenibacillus]MBU5444691.1 glutamyl-tRNA reductase [Paenibacillus sp. MSJ-34]CAH0119152.1 Glutamyl-tRNA reductase [Paenibacillus sp. CECT 9249]
MHIIVVGLNYRTTPLEVREKFAFSEKVLPEALRQLKQTKSVLECVIVSTCNRTELYVVVDRLHMCGHFVRSFMEQWFQIPRREFTHHLYIYEDEQAIEHLFRVASGLDSMVIGETQILGQVKNALALAQQSQTTGAWFNTLFKQAITMAKRAHAETAIGEAAVSVSYAAVELGKRIFGKFAGKKVLILGAGKMSELTVKHLYAGGAEEVTVANRTLPRAEQLAVKLGGKACTLREGLGRLHEMDIVISSTGSEQFVLMQDEVKAAMNKRRGRPLFMIDIAVPRDLDPNISQIPNVFLYDIDDLQGIVESNLEQRRKESAKIEAMIAAEMEAFRQWLKTLGVSPLIRALQEKSAHIHEETMESLLNKLPELDERQVKVIRKLTKSIVNQMMRDPIARVKEMASEKHADEALDMFVKLFALEEQLAEAELDAEKHISSMREETPSSHAVREDRAAAEAKGALSWAAATLN